ncbi:MAG: hypothetical protein KBC27_03430 [Rickettsiales bacterium]|nr:hypothetical protein [Rickettsiales bacterium]
MKQSNKVFGGTLIVAGTAIGAGMLALPMLSATMGFFNSICFMTVMWLLSLFSAFITVEIILYYGRDVSVPYLSGKFLGKSFKLVGAVSLLVLLYSVLSAYISGLSSVINKNITWGNLREGYIALIIAVLSGYIIFLSIRAVDYTNRILFIAKIVVFVLVLITFIPYIQSDNFLVKSPVSNIPEIVLVFFTSFGFHGSIPTVIKYVGKDVKALRKVFFWGSAIPFVVYILWQGVTLGVLPFEGDHSFSNVFLRDRNVGVFINDLSAITNNQTLRVILDIFSILAMVTSILGVAIGLFDYIVENFKDKAQQYIKVKAIILTLGIPLIFSVYYPSGFILALNFAAISLVILAIILPSLVALNVRKNYMLNQYKVFGGNIMLYFSVAVGGFLIALRVYQLL